jgi:hypothetical protein
MDWPGVWYGTQIQAFTFLGLTGRFFGENDPRVSDQWQRCVSEAPEKCRQRLEFRRKVSLRIVVS